MREKKTSVLLIDQDSSLRELFSEILEERGFSTKSEASLTCISRETFCNLDVLICSSTLMPQSVIFKYFDEVKDFSNKALTVLFTGNQHLLEQSIWNENIDMKWPKTTGFSNLISEVEKVMLRGSPFVFDYTETVVGMPRKGREYWAQSYLRVAYPDSISREDRDKRISTLIVGETKEEVLKESEKVVLDYNYNRHHLKKGYLSHKICDLTRGVPGK